MHALVRWTVGGTLALALATPLRAAGGFVLGAGLGTSEVGTACTDNDDPALSRRCDTTSSGHKLFAGYRWLDPESGLAAGLEVFHADFGAMEFEGEIDAVPVAGRAAASGTGLVGTVEVPILKRWSLLAKLGACRWQVDARAGRIGEAPVYTKRPSGVGLAGGLGAAYQIADHLALRLEAEGVGGVGDDNILQDDVVVLASIGLAVSF